VLHPPAETVLSPVYDRSPLSPHLPGRFYPISPRFPRFFPRPINSSQFTSSFFSVSFFPPDSFSLSLAFFWLAWGVFCGFFSGCVVLSLLCLCGTRMLDADREVSSFAFLGRLTVNSRFSPSADLPWLFWLLDPPCFGTSAVRLRQFLAALPFTFPCRRFAVKVSYNPFKYPFPRCSVQFRLIVLFPR